MIHFNYRFILLKSSHRNPVSPDLLHRVRVETWCSNKQYFNVAYDYTFFVLYVMCYDKVAIFPYNKKINKKSEKPDFSPGHRSICARARQMIPDLFNALTTRFECFLQFVLIIYVAFLSYNVILFLKKKNI